jgi:hypothetical protein
MKLRYLLVLAAALPLAGLASLPDTAWAHSTGGGGGGFHGGSFRGGGMRMAPRPNFQRGRTGNISRYQLNNSHNKNYKLNKGTVSSKPLIKPLSSTQKTVLGKPNGKFSVQKLGTNKHFKNASFSKKNVWSNKVWGGKGLHHHDHDHWHRWYGPVFWPYFFGDYFCYGFWPDECSDVYWGYGPDVIVWGAFWPAGEYNYDEPAAEEAANTGDIYGPYRNPVRTANKQPANKQPDASSVAETCSGFAPGVSDLPVQKLEGIIDASEEQRTAFQDLKAAVAQASDILKKACPSEAPLTPVSRLDAMEHRLQAMEQANVVVKGPFVRLYGLLTDGQKQRLHAVTKPAGKPQLASSKGMNVAELCTSQAGFTSVPSEQISSALTLTDVQQQQLDNLKTASAQASEELKNSCPASAPDTLDGRLDAAQQRIAALIGAVGTVRPAVRDFYATLTDEQKAALSIKPATQNRG